jgi:hypothetical protein
VGGGHNKACLEPDHATPSCPLGVGELPSTPLPFERSRNADCSVVEVKITPCQRKIFAGRRPVVIASANRAS